jgi:two-component system response regulator HydG
VREISDEALRALVAYEWPGNVRELENEIARACELSSGPVLMSVDFSREVQQVSERLRHLSESPEPEATVIGGQAVSSIRPIAELERNAILDSIRKLKGDKLLAAKLLGIGKTTLYRKLKEYGVREWGEAG